MKRLMSKSLPRSIFEQVSAVGNLMKNDIRLISMSSWYPHERRSLVKLGIDELRLSPPAMCTIELMTGSVIRIVLADTPLRPFS